MKKKELRDAIYCVLSKAFLDDRDPPWHFRSKSIFLDVVAKDIVRLVKAKDDDPVICQITATHSCDETNNGYCDRCGAQIF